MSEYRKIKDLREDHDYTQKYVSNYLKVNRSTYANWESGDNDTPLEIVDKLSIFYNVSLSYLLGLSNNKYKVIRPMKYDYLLITLNKLKKKNKFTYNTIAEYIGVSKSTCYKYYNGIYPIPTHILILLCELHKIDIDKLCFKI